MIPVSFSPGSQGHAGGVCLAGGDVAEPEKEPPSEDAPHCLFSHAGDLQTASSHAGDLQTASGSRSVGFLHEEKSNSDCRGGAPQACQMLVCRECHQEFEFTAAEKDYFQERGFIAPKRCKQCRTGSISQHQRAVGETCINCGSTGHRSWECPKVVGGGRNFQKGKPKKK